MNNENENTNLCNFEGGTKSVPNYVLLVLILLEVWQSYL
ncbi:hypothetical protein HMPREF1057_00921 [Bacteroides finegoldii CL09T03C10]|uniref:Uncharacterized protein n=1 Tax=Bacteroides finegoldii CL09T03C10 TaxID=997888 RepID=K5CQI7_9BACE|nr:hypothetical protein HMPREF1057_00921 [Bacteroides finegoldii CL09T03C10]